MHRSKLAFGLLATLAVALPAGESHAVTLTVLASFNGTNSNGQFANPGNLTLSGSTLYGVTEYGGANGDGTVFSVPVTGGTPTTLVTFNGANGANPQGNLTLIGSTLYGITSSGGPNNGGEIFSVPVTGGAPTFLASEGANDPDMGLTLSADGSKFYVGGGAGGYVGVVSIPVTGGTPTLVSSFNRAEGYGPGEQMTLSPDGSTLYGTTFAGGDITLSNTEGYGVVFSLPVTGGTPTVLAEFNSTTGANPYGGVTLGADGSTLYGMTSDGVGEVGTIFSLPVTGGTPNVLSYIGQSEGNLALVGSTLYGMTGEGGTNNAGTIFSIPAGGTPTTLLSFTGSNGALPTGSFTASGSTLYATTYLGGAYGDGAVIALNLAPEPSSLALLGLGAIGLAAAAARQKMRRRAA